MQDFYQATPEEQTRRLQQAGQTALAQWGIEKPTLGLIKYRENAVFKVDHDNQRMALRMHRHGYHSDAALRSELQWMQALAAAGVPTPTIIPSSAGELFVKVEGPGLPGQIQVDLFEWIDGEQLGSVEEGISDAAQVVSTYQTLGSLAGRVHNQSSTWPLPDGFTRHAWDAAGLAGDNPLWGRFWELQAASSEQRELLIRLRDRLFTDLSALPKTASTYSLVHADFAPENLMVDGDTVRLIDFDDAGFGWHLFELATSLYFIIGEPYFEQAKTALVEGYRQQRELSDDDLALLPLFLAARGTTYLGWVHTRSETETARELTPMLLELACSVAEEYL